MSKSQELYQTLGSNMSEVKNFIKPWDLNMSKVKCFIKPWDPNMSKFKNFIKPWDTQTCQKSRTLSNLGIHTDKHYREQSCLF
jgi:hypothetical protein